MSRKKKDFTVEDAKENEDTTCDDNLDQYDTYDDYLNSFDPTQDHQGFVPFVEGPVADEQVPVVDDDDGAIDDDDGVFDATDHPVVEKPVPSQQAAAINKARLAHGDTDLIEAQPDPLPKPTPDMQGGPAKDDV